MRVCPKCGFHDAPVWRNSRFYFNGDVVRISDLEMWDDNLLRKLKDATDGYYEDGHFSYLLSSAKQVVLRKETELLNKDIEGTDQTSKKEKWFTITIEKRRKAKCDNQCKLLELGK